jgi:hypothetical protein
MGSPASAAEQTGVGARALIGEQWEGIGEWGESWMPTGVVVDLLIRPKKEGACRANWNGKAIGRIWSAPPLYNPLQLPGGLRIKMPPSNFGLHKLLQDGREAKKPVVGRPIPRSDTSSSRLPPRNEP